MIFSVSLLSSFIWSTPSSMSVDSWWEEISRYVELMWSYVIGWTLLSKSTDSPSRWRCSLENNLQKLHITISRFNFSREGSLSAYCSRCFKTKKLISNEYEIESNQVLESSKDTCIFGFWFSLGEFQWSIRIGLLILFILSQPLSTHVHPIKNGTINVPFWCRRRDLNPHEIAFTRTWI